MSDSSSEACKKLIDSFYLTGISHFTHISKNQDAQHRQTALLAVFAHVSEMTVNSNIRTLPSNCSVPFTFSEIMQNKFSDYKAAE